MVLPLILQTAMSGAAAANVFCVTAILLEVKVGVDIARFIHRLGSGSAAVINNGLTKLRNSTPDARRLSRLFGQRPAVTDNASPATTTASPPPIFIAGCVIYAIVVLLLIIRFVKAAHRSQLRKKAAIKLQSYGRSWRATQIYRHVKSAAAAIQKACRSRAAMLAAAATTIESECRRFLARRDYLVAIAAAIKIQSCVRRWRTYWMAGAAIDARLLVRGELQGTGLRRRRLAVERLREQSRKLDNTNKADAAVLICRVAKGHLVRMGLKKQLRLEKKKSFGSRGSVEGGTKAGSRGTVEGGNKRRGMTGDTGPTDVARVLEFGSKRAPSPPLPADFLPGAAGEEGLTARELLDEIRKELRTYATSPYVAFDGEPQHPYPVHLPQQTQQPQTTAALPGAMPPLLAAANSAPALLTPTPPQKRPSFSNAGVAMVRPPSPSGSEKKRGAMMSAVMGELKGRLAIRRTHHAPSPRASPRTAVQVD